MTTKAIAETQLYQPVKTLLEEAGYTVKAEVADCDVVAMKLDDPDADMLIAELKTAFNLSLLQQASERLRITPNVYIAFPKKSGRLWYKTFVVNKRICRQMGIGLILVDLANGTAIIKAEPGPFKPRCATRKKQRIETEFKSREGDPNTGGQTRTQIVTAYRQNAEKCAAFLRENGPSKGAVVAKAVSVPKATRLMADNHYGWFVRVEKGIYGLSESMKSTPA